MKRVLAFDFGASSGRAILAEYQDGRLTYKEVHRFENCPREQDGHFRWDFADLMANVRLGIEKAGPFDSIGFDTWGVDFGLLDEQGQLLGDPVHYRDSRTEGMVEKALQTMPAAALYAATGSQIMGINTLFQLLAVKESDPEIWDKAKRLLFMPDLFAHALCGSDACETTIASTSQMLDANTRNWSKEVLDAFAIPENLFAPRVDSGAVVGEYKGAKVIAVAGHDTQCAVAAMPAPEENAAFLSCGTWSLLGCELDAPVLTEQSRLLALSNEQGANGKVNYLKNIIGLWLIQASPVSGGGKGRSIPTPTWKSWPWKPSPCAALSTPTPQSSPLRETSPAGCRSSAAAPVSRCLKQWARSCAASTKAWP